MHYAGILSNVRTMLVPAVAAFLPCSPMAISVVFSTLYHVYVERTVDGAAVTVGS
jgi:hypothetical protein